MRWVCFIFIAGIACAARAETTVRVDQSNARVGVIGDVHANMGEVRRAVKLFKGQGVNVVFGMGDFTDWGELQVLNDVLREVSTGLALPKSNFVLVPGNMEDHFKKPSDFGPVMERYGKMATDSSSWHGFVDLNGTHRFMLSHIAHTRPPARLLPPAPYGPRGDALETFEREIVPSDVHMALFGDSHVGGSFVHPNGLVLMNVGTLSDRKAPSEKKSVGLILPEQGIAQRLDVASGEVIEVCPFSRLGK